MKKYFHFNKDILECPICFATIKQTPIYQCRNGHVVRKNCPTCRDGPISQRNRKIEEIVESVTQIEIKTMGCCCGCYFCGCFGIQMGAKVILILSLIFHVLLQINTVSTDVNLSDRLMMQFFNDPSGFFSGHEINPVLVKLIIINLILIALGVFAIIGIFLKKPGFMVGWLIVHMIALVLFRIVSLVTTIVIMTSFFTGASSYDTSALIVGGSLFIGFLVALNWLGYYFWNIVRSALIEIEQEDGLWYALEFQLCNYIFR